MCSGRDKMSQFEVVRFRGLDAIISPSVRIPEHFVPKPERERENPKISPPKHLN